MNLAVDNQSRMPYSVHMKTTCPAAQLPALIEFMKDFPGCQVRDQKLARNSGIPSRLGGTKEYPLLRTAKNDHLAAIWDELENVFVLTKTGTRKQLTKSEFFCK